MTSYIKKHSTSKVLLGRLTHLHFTAGAVFFFSSKNSSLFLRLSSTNSSPRGVEAVLVNYLTKQLLIVDGNAILSIMPLLPLLILSLFSYSLSFFSRHLPHPLSPDIRNIAGPTLAAHASLPSGRDPVATRPVGPCALAWRWAVHLGGHAPTTCMPFFAPTRGKFDIRARWGFTDSNLSKEQYLRSFRN